MVKIPKIPDIPESELTPSMMLLLEINRLQQEQIQQLKDEIARLKNQKPKPNIKPSKLEKPKSKKNQKGKKRPGSKKKAKTRSLEIHEVKPIRPDPLPEGSEFKDYQDYVVQDIVLKNHNIRYRLERWTTPQGDYVTGKLPPEVIDGHFGPTLVSYVLYLYYHSHVTQPLIRQHLQAFGVDISTGQISRILTEGKDQFHTEKDAILRTGLEVSRYVNVDDTGARHNGKNGYCTHIGNEYFAWFESTESKSRINFLTLLHAGPVQYILNVEAIAYMAGQGLAKWVIERLSSVMPTGFDSEATWVHLLGRLNITDERHIRIATEGALVGSLIENGFQNDIVIVSDDAGQFNVFLHALCWIHAERTIHKLVGISSAHQQALDHIRCQIWQFYAELKAYKAAPDQEKKNALNARFDEIFTCQTCFATLNQALKRIYKNKKELLLVLDFPDIPLHNNLSENDIREYVKRRKISGSTRSPWGRRCRDTFTSLKKTCRKLNVSFWDYLKDRITSANRIPLLSDLVRLRAQGSMA
jgi:hypothetical protein